MYRVVWYYNVENRLVREQPAIAGARAAHEAAGIAAAAIKSQYTGELARQVAMAHAVGPLRWLVGSSLPYAAMEHFGGQIHPRGPYLAVGARGGMGMLGGRSGNSGRPVTLVGPGPPPRGRKPYVDHVGKGYLNWAVSSFPALFMSNLRSIGG